MTHTVANYLTTETAPELNQAIVVPPTLVLFLHNDAADVATYEKLLSTPAGGTEDSDAAVLGSADGEVLLDSYITYPTTGLGFEVLLGGVWYFNTYLSVDNASVGVSTCVIRVYQRNTSGTETELFNTTSPQITSTSAELYQFPVTVSDMIFNPADRIVIKYLAKTTSAADRTITLYYEGTQHYSHINTPSQVEVPASGGAASDITASTTNFGGNLSAADDTVQKALDTLDDVTVGSVALADITDVTITSVSDGDVLTYDSGSGDWINGAGGTGSGNVTYSTAYSSRPAA